MMLRHVTDTLDTRNLSVRLVRNPVGPITSLMPEVRSQLP